MRIDELKPLEESLFEDKDINNVINVAAAGETVWSKPMSAEDAIALTLGHPVKNVR